MSDAVKYYTALNMDDGQTYLAFILADNEYQALYYLYSQHPYFQENAYVYRHGIEYISPNDIHGLPTKRAHIKYGKIIPLPQKSNRESMEHWAKMHKIPILRRKTLRYFQNGECYETNAMEHTEAIEKKLKKLGN